MELSLIVNNTTVASYAADGFNSNKFDAVRLEFLKLLNKFEKQAKVINNDLETIMKIVNKHKGFVTENFKYMNDVFLQASKSWESVIFEEDIDKSIPVSFFKGNIAGMNNLITTFKDVDYLGFTYMKLNDILVGSSFDSINANLFLSDDEEDSFGINRFNLLIFQFKTGYRITKKKIYNGYIYNFNLDVFRPYLNLISTIISDKDLLNIMLPLLGCYESEMKIFFGLYITDWKNLKGEDSDE
jgi:hypothetical protein